jgi:hypothetical protein
VRPLVLAAKSALLRLTRTLLATVGKWRQRFIDHRLDGLYDEPRVGAPRTVSHDDVEAVIVKTLETTPPGETHWSTRTMAAKAGLSPHHDQSDLADVRPETARHRLVQDVAGSAAH